VTNGRIENGEKRLQWIPVSKMRISPRAQRHHDKPGSKAHSRYIADNFDPDKFGTPIVNHRDGVFWVIDGGHRYLALILLGWEDQQVQCWVYQGLSEHDEADKFLDLNSVKPVSAMDKFQVAIVAKREIECDIDRIVRAQDLTVGTGAEAIGCVAAIGKTYVNGGPKVLATSLRVIRDAYGLPGFSARMTEGVGLFVANYENTFDEARLIDRLAHKLGGVNGLISRSEQIRKSHGVSGAVGIAAAAVETYNAGRGGGGKLNGWWSTFNVKEDP
jgi:hypothetical protein